MYCIKKERKRVCFSAAGLAIGKHGSGVSLQCRDNQITNPTVVKHFFLGGLAWKKAIVPEMLYCTSYNF